MPFEFILGADAVDELAPRLDFAASELYLLTDLAGSDAARGRVCDAVFPAPLRGGGTLLVGGSELPFPGRRITVAACLAPDPSPAVPPSARGTSVLLVQTTSIGPTLLGAAGYDRYRVAQGGAPPAREDLPAVTVRLPSGPIIGGLAVVPSLALTATGDGARGGCGEVYASHYLALADCDPETDASCPCVAGEPCGARAVVELTPATGVEVVVVPDDDPTLQALRSELRPAEAEIDGLLGTDVLRATELDVDYPHNRLAWRCTDDAACATRPILLGADTRADVATCLTP
ncbi:MAG: hypothetical protein R2939_13360 [Kofleriaceae bacterium]